MKSRRGGSWADSLQNMIGMNGKWKAVKDDGSDAPKTTKGGRLSHRKGRAGLTRSRVGKGSRKGSRKGRGKHRKGSKGMRGGQDHWFTKLGVGVHKFEDPAGYVVETDRIPEYNVGLPHAPMLGSPEP